MARYLLVLLASINIRGGARSIKVLRRPGMSLTCSLLLQLAQAYGKFLQGGGGGGGGAVTHLPKKFCKLPKLLRNVQSKRNEGHYDATT